MYTWQNDIEEYVDLASTFQSDTARANAFTSKRRNSPILCFTGFEAVCYFEQEFKHDLTQAVDFGKTLMGDGAFLRLDGKYGFERTSATYRFTWQNSKELADMLLMQRTPEVTCIESKKGGLGALKTPDMSDDEFSEASIQGFIVTQECIYDTEGDESDSNSSEVSKNISWIDCNGISNPLESEIFNELQHGPVVTEIGSDDEEKSEAQENDGMRGNSLEGLVKLRKKLSIALSQNSKTEFETSADLRRASTQGTQRSHAREVFSEEPSPESHSDAELKGEIEDVDKGSTSILHGKIYSPLVSQDEPMSSKADKNSKELDRQGEQGAPIFAGTLAQPCVRMGSAKEDFPETQPTVSNPTTAVVCQYGCEETTVVTEIGSDDEEKSEAQENDGMRGNSLEGLVKLRKKLSIALSQNSKTEFETSADLQRVSTQSTQRSLTREVFSEEPSPRSQSDVNLKGEIEDVDKGSTSILHGKICFPLVSQDGSLSSQDDKISNELDKQGEQGAPVFAATLAQPCVRMGSAKEDFRETQPTVSVSTSAAACQHDCKEALGSQKAKSKYSSVKEFDENSSNQDGLYEGPAGMAIDFPESTEETSEGSIWDYCKGEGTSQGSNHEISANSSKNHLKDFGQATEVLDDTPVQTDESKAVEFSPEYPSTTDSGHKGTIVEMPSKPVEIVPLRLPGSPNNRAIQTPTVEAGDGTKQRRIGPGMGGRPSVHDRREPSSPASRTLYSFSPQSSRTHGEEFTGSSNEASWGQNSSSGGEARSTRPAAAEGKNLHSAFAGWGRGVSLSLKQSLSSPRSHFSFSLSPRSSAARESCGQGGNRAGQLANEAEEGCQGGARGGEEPKSAFRHIASKGKTALHLISLSSFFSSGKPDDDPPVSSTPPERYPSENIGTQSPRPRRNGDKSTSHGERMLSLKRGKRCKYDYGRQASNVHIGEYASTMASPRGKARDNQQTVQRKPQSPTGWRTTSWRSTSYSHNAVLV